MALKAVKTGPRCIDARIARPPPKQVEPFYTSPEWRGLMRQIFHERGRQCVACGTRRGRMFGDHIIEIKDGGRKLDKANIQVLCGTCHNTKTARERQNRKARGGR